MSKEVYDLSSISGGVDYLKDGYIDYAQEVIVNRALPELYDGLKPVHRHILYWMWRNRKGGGFVKCATLAGNVLCLHPHGDSSVYAAMVLMTSNNGSLAFPLLEGTGNFGGVCKDDPPAAMRYTEARLHPYADEYFGEMSGVNMMDNFDSTLKEPELLPASFPSVLVNATSGIAVGFRCNIPSFNFVDVCNLVKEYIKDGSCHTVICPDFVTGGYYVRNDKELEKLMLTGTGKLKLRAKYGVDGKQITIHEFPYGRTIQKLLRQINDLNVQAIRNAYDTDDFSGSSLTIDCAGRNKVEEALYYLIRDTDFEYTYSADITVVYKDFKCGGRDVPKRLGVWKVIEEWVKWRKGVVLKDLAQKYKDLEESMKSATAFMNIINSQEKKLELVNVIARDGKAAGCKYIEKNFTRAQVPGSLIDFCASQSLSSYHDGGKYRTIYLNGKQQLESLKKDMDDVSSVICRQMDNLIKKYGDAMKRRTEVTTQEFNFEEVEEKKPEKVIDNTVCVFELRDNFLRKVPYAAGGSVNAEHVVVGKSCDTLIAFDNRGRVLRIYGQDIQMSGAGVGTYLPSYLNLQEADDYRITWLGLLDGRELMLLYKDGNVGFVDTSEWADGGRQIKVLKGGISSSSAPYLGAVLSDVPEVLFVGDEDGNIAWARTSGILKKKRTAKTRVFNLRHGRMLDSYFGCDYVSAMLKLSGFSAYEGTLKELKNIEDFHDDPGVFQDMS